MAGSKLTISSESKSGQRLPSRERMEERARQPVWKLLGCRALNGFGLGKEGERRGKIQTNPGRPGY